MTKFDRKLFYFHGGYLTYGTTYANRKFVARFKYRGPFTKTKFLKQLVANHTVEEYFHELEVEKNAPLAILRDKDQEWYYGILEAFAGRPVARVW